MWILIDLAYKQNKNPNSEREIETLRINDDVITRPYSQFFLSHTSDLIISQKYSNGLTQPQSKGRKINKSITKRALEHSDSSESKVEPWTGSAISGSVQEDV